MHGFASVAEHLTEITRQSSRRAGSARQARLLLRRHLSMPRWQSGLVLGFGRIVLVDLTGGSGLFLIRESSWLSDVLRLAVELPLSSVGIRRRPLAVAAIVTQLTIFNCAGYGGAGASAALAGGGPDLWSARCRQPGVGNLPMIVASRGLCGGRRYLADSAGRGRRHWLVLAAAP